MLAAASAHEQAKFNQHKGTEPSVRRPSLAKVRNNTGANLERFAVVGLAGPIISPSLNLVEFQRQTALEGILPSEEKQFAVLLEPLAAGMIGLATVAGVVPVRVSVGVTEYRCAVPIDDEFGYLRNVPRGPAQLLWMESTGAIRWALMRFDDSNYEEIVYITSNIPDAAGMYPGVVQKYDLQTQQWTSQYPCKVLDANR